MDSITLRIPLVKTRHWKVTKAKLAKILIITELIGIAVMIWYLHSPLYQKFLAVKPKAYSLQAFSSDTRYLLSENDFLFGTAVPGYKVKLIFTAGRQKRTVQVSEKGNWVAQLPDSLEHKPYRVTAAYFDTSNKLTKVESYKILVQSEVILYQNKLYRYYVRPFLPSTVQAAEPKASSDPGDKPAIIGLGAPSSWSKELTDWMSKAQSLGIYPYCEYNGLIDSSCSEISDLVLTNYTTYANVCQQTVSCFISPDATTLINPQIGPILFQSLAGGEPMAYAAVAQSLESILPIAPSYRNLVQDLSSSNVDSLNSEEQAFLDQRDGKIPNIKPYVDIENSLPSSN